ncbi:MAG TPA: hypothetical protein VM123_12860 [archaeon]|nr:hypothetical protein [archaeon]
MEKNHTISRWWHIFVALLLAAFYTIPGSGPVYAQIKSLDLSGVWYVTWTDGSHSAQGIDVFSRMEPAADPDRYIKLPVPMELHLALQEKGLVEDPNIGINSLKARWVCKQYWQYFTTFTPPTEALSKKAWLVFDQLDINATILLNGEGIGSHVNAHLPCRLEVTGKLKPGDNKLAVAIESGLYYVADLPGREYTDGLGTILNKRHWLRKPQYQFSWDWNPRLINVGITGPVRLEWGDKVRPDQVAVLTAPAKDFSRARVTVRAFLEGLGAEKEAVLHARVRETGEEVSRPVKLAPGLALYEAELTMNRPKLWWPAGHGEQALYNLDLEVIIAGQVVESTSRRFGVREVKINRSPHPVEGEYFIIEVNGQPVFCKGGNWVPPDMIYSSVDRERLQKLVQLALKANFNFLRIWGGGTWAGHDLLELCDEAGILVWHDFLFCVARFPGDDPEFLAEAKREITWGVREFACHPSLAVWCGNNELEWGAWDWGYAERGKSLPDYAIYHHVMPVIMREEDPLRPFWPSSPYSPNHIHPNSPVIGDQHPWTVTLGEHGPDFWAYRAFVDRFPNEGGVLGASSPETLRQFLPEGQRYVRSFAWEHHDNGANFWRADTPITYRLVDYWLGKNYKEMEFDDYVFASALLQAEGLTEYITNYRRRMFSSSSAIFWMYNDSWPVTHGWTIVDYYLRKKLSYHPVRRAFSPVTVVVADEGEKITVFGVNDSHRDWKGTLRYGIFGFSGGLPVDQTKQVRLPANKSTALAVLSRAQWEKLGFASNGAFAVLMEKRTAIAQHKLLLEPFKNLTFAKPEIKINRGGDKITLTSPVFVWGACLDLDGEENVADNCFDLIPGIPYPVKWHEGKELPVIKMTGNDLMLKRK